MDSQTFSNISKIIERDSKFTTYKFALLRGVIDVIQENSPYIKEYENTVEIPLGLMIEKWIVYYYPIASSNVPIPQINGKSNKLAFYPYLVEVINHYNQQGGLSFLYNEMRTKGINEEIRIEFVSLTKSLRNTIVKQPMKYIGRSISEDYYSIFKYKPANKRNTSNKVTTQWLIDSFGYFTIPTAYYEAFKILGSFLTGGDSILFKWAEFSVNASSDGITTEKVINEILKGPVTTRDAVDAKAFYKAIVGNNKSIECVWSGLQLNNYDVDHLIPFSVWRNNDLWNLLPSDPKINNQKRDKIPSIMLLDQRKDIIIHYWELIQNSSYERFNNEIGISLTGNQRSGNWQNIAFEQLKKTAKNLINVRGYEEWSFSL